MSHLLRDLDLLEPLRARLADGLPAYGACAGMILLAREILDAGANGREAVPLRAIDMTVRRNAFGRQVDSFEGDLEFAGLDGRCMRCSSARPGWSGPAPRCRCWPRGRAYRGGSAGPDVGDGVSPEMTGDRRIHRLFVDIVNGRA
ncbi:glutamine amidotransferase subunit pdxT [Mycobacterium xenopi 3993]|nr:glutamine amidotransferase subunit pdxT [Mycobacterium xenopi 3993]